MPATRSAPRGDVGERVGDRRQAARVGEHGVRSLNWMPGSGKSGTSRISDAMTAAAHVDAVPSSLTALNAQRSMFQPAPHRVGLLLTAYIFVDVSKVRCWR